MTELNTIANIAAINQLQSNDVGLKKHCKHCTYKAIGKEIQRTPKVSV